MLKPFWFKTDPKLGLVVLCRVGWLPYMAMKRPAASPTSPNTKARLVKLRKEAEKKGESSYLKFVQSKVPLDAAKISRICAEAAQRAAEKSAKDCQIQSFQHMKRYDEGFLLLCHGAHSKTFMRFCKCNRELALRRARLHTSG